jgi:hypothetical protein
LAVASSPKEAGCREVLQFGAPSGTLLSEKNEPFLIAPNKFPANHTCPEDATTPNFWHCENSKKYAGEQKFRLFS